MTRRTLFTGLLPGLLLGAAPLASWAQRPPLHDSVFVRQHRIRTVAVLWSATEDNPQRLTEQDTQYFARSGGVRRRTNPHDAERAEQLRGPRYRYEVVRDARGREVATRTYRDEELESTEYQAYGPLNKVIQTYIHSAGTSYLRPYSYWDFKATYHYDARGNHLETVYNGVSMLGERLWFPARWRHSYDARGRRIATVQYEQLIYPYQTDSTYYNDRDQITRTVSYSHSQGQPRFGRLMVQRYDAQGRLITHIEVENGGAWHKIERLHYRADGLLATVVLSTAHQQRVRSWPQALRRTEATLRRATDFRQTRTVYAYNQRGLPTEIREYLLPYWCRPTCTDTQAELLSRQVWRYTYYP